MFPEVFNKINSLEIVFEVLYCLTAIVSPAPPSSPVAISKTVSASPVPVTRNQPWSFFVVGFENAIPFPNHLDCPSAID